MSKMPMPINSVSSKHSAQSMKRLKIKFLPGYVAGLRYPSILCVHRMTKIDLKRIKQHLTWLRSKVSIQQETLYDYNVNVSGDEKVDTFISAVLEGVFLLQQSVGIPVFEAGKCLEVTANADVVLVFPVMNSASVAPIANALAWWLGFLSEDRLQTDALKAFSFHQTQLKSLAPRGSNVARFVRAAFDAQIPFRWLSDRVIQYGDGQHSHWLDSSFTDKTPYLSVIAARDKQMAALFLRRSGIPVPNHRAVHSVNEARNIAKQLGFPVVVKPMDMDGGLGVSAGLLTDEQVTKAYAYACKYSKNILVEKHVEGRDYRLTVFHDELIWAIEREVAGVYGDGVSSIKMLVAKANEDIMRGDAPASPLKRIKLDEEALSLIAFSGLSEESVPLKGQFVKLKRAANVASGGTPIAVFDRVHPDNADLAIRAAKALRLDMAGIDLLISDISRSWREVGAAVCEVNAQPNLGQITSLHLYEPILRKLVGRHGRIRSVLFIGQVDPYFMLRCRCKLHNSGFNQVGWSDDQGVYMNEHLIVGKQSNLYQAGQALVVNQQVDAMMLNLWDDQLLADGLPTVYWDNVLVCGWPFNVDVLTHQQRNARLHQLLKQISPYTNTSFLVLENSVAYLETDSDIQFNVLTENQFIDTFVA